MQIDLIEALKKYLNVFNIYVYIIKPPFDDFKQFDYGLRNEIDPMFDWNYFGLSILNNQKPATLIITEDTFGAKYATFSMPKQTDFAVLIGPWRGEKQSKEQIHWAQTALSAKAADAVKRYFDVIPQINENTVIRSIIELVKMLYPNQDFKIENVFEYRPFIVANDSRFFSEPNFLHEYSASLLQERYDAENAFIQAITEGKTNEALQAFQSFRRFNLGERFNANIRNRKNGLIISNTLFRKAIEKAGVHPYYIDIISSKYSYKIETITTKNDALEMTDDMIKEYCTYVQRYALKKYSPTIQKVINYINFNLDKHLTLKSLADLCFISPNYLSGLFSKETGSTLTEYINMQRMNRAAYALLNTQKTVSAIAGEVGIWDVNYFTKIFKKHMGCTPTKYRVASK